nr:rna-binding protein mrn1 [Quercus suber]
MATSTKVTVDKAYFDALLPYVTYACNAVVTDLQLQHTSARGRDPLDPGDVILPTATYDGLGGVTETTLQLLISHTEDSAPVEYGEPGVATISWADDSRPDLPSPKHIEHHSRTPGEPTKSSMRYRDPATTSHTHFNRDGPGFRCDSRNGNELSAIGDDAPSEDGDDETLNDDATGVNRTTDNRTLYFCGFPEGTTYEDVLSIISGGKVVNINMRSERSATATLFDGAAAYLSWATRNGIYIRSKRISVRWADRQYQLSNHVAKNVANGATRNVIVHSAQERGLTEPQIRADMEHIHNLVVIKVTFHRGSAVVSMNSVHNALFARTCMLSRSTYKGCKVEFYPDECNLPLPVRTQPGIPPSKRSARKQDTVTNRFDLLGITDNSDDSGMDKSTHEHSDSDTGPP